MTDIRWLTRQMVEAFHAESIARFGCEDGLRDEGFLESALARPLNLAGYESPVLTELAAAYAFGIIQNHPFIHGNKRAGLLAARTFLSLNGLLFDPDETSTVHMIEGVASGTFNETEFASWILAHSASK